MRNFVITESDRINILNQHGLVSENTLNLIYENPIIPRKLVKALSNNAKRKILDLKFIKKGGFKNFDEVIVAIKNGKISPEQVSEIVIILFKNSTGADQKKIATVLLNTQSFRKKYIKKTIKETREALKNANFNDNEIEIIIKQYNFEKLLGGIPAGLKAGFKIESGYLPILDNLRKFNLPFKNFTPDERTKFLVWLGTGTSRLPKDIVNMLKDKGIIYFVASLGGEFVKRYLTVMLILSSLNAIKIILTDNLTSVAERDPDTLIKNILLVAEQAWLTPDYKWILPFLVSWKAFKIIVGPIFAGNFPYGVLDNLENEIEKLEKEKEIIIEKAKKAKEKNIENKKETATVEGAKEVAPEYIQNYIWEDENGNIFLRVEGPNDLLITRENDVYMIQLPDEKIKLKDY